MLLCRSSLFRSTNPDCLSASHKVDKGDDGGGIKDDESAGRIGNARERADLDAGERGQAERVERKLRPERRSIERLGQEDGGDQKRQQGKGRRQSRKFMGYEFESNRVLRGQQPWSKLEKLIVAAQGANLAGKFTAFSQVGRVPGAGAGVEDDARSTAHDLHRQQDVVEDGARGQWVKQCSAGTVDGAGGASDRTGGGLQLANLLFHAPVQPHSLSGLS